MIVLALGFFGVGVDALHSLLSHLTGTDLFGTVAQQALGMVEDGGEMLIGSLAVAFTLTDEAVAPAVSPADQPQTGAGGTSA
ncbi:hypothetical protein [Rhodobacter calidifons]|uniref:Uncharacterized protein n=1 Tax=Rhodobacter calidifons TaxID=2715277 RepID=A0ABX0G478_9RHOB|nr:hypothetical protein [Rhodobacter calidifons]NHB75688.1 hypothetical protein [Rhodobacter calidifons]